MAPSLEDQEQETMSNVDPSADQPQETPTNLDRLTEWIDGPHPFKPLTDAEAMFLWKPEFTESDLKDAFVYVLSRGANTLEDSNEFQDLARTQHKQNATLQSFAKVDLDEPSSENVLPLENLCKEMLRDVDVKKEKRFRRSIVMMCRVVKRIKIQDKELRRQIGKAQGDL